MKSLGTGSVFADEIIELLPVNYRFMTIIETSSFREHYNESRFSTSKRYFSKKYINSSSYKPLSEIIYQDLFKNEEAE